MHALLSGRLLPRPELAAMERLRPAAGFAGYGLGLAAVPSACGRRLGHPGEYPGYDTRVFASPGGRHVAVVAWNLFPSTSMATDRAFAAVTQRTLCAGQ